MKDHLCGKHKARNDDSYSLYLREGGLCYTCAPVQSSRPYSWLDGLLSASFDHVCMHACACVCVHACVYMCICMRVRECVRVYTLCLQKPEYSLGCYSSGTLRLLCCLRQGLSMAWNVSPRLGQMGSEPQDLCFFTSPEQGSQV